MIRRRALRAGILAGLLAALAAVLAVAGSASAQEVRGTATVYEDGGRVDSLRSGLDPQRLEELRREATSRGRPRDWYDLGAALLLSGDWEGAIEPLERVASAADGKVSTSATYNLGVAHGVGARPRPGQGSASPGADAVRTGLTRARDAFRRVLRADPDAEDARWNLEVVNRWLRKMGGGGGPSAGGGGQQGDRGERREMTPEEVERLLRAAASEERRVQEDRFEKSRARDPVAERNW